MPSACDVRDQDRTNAADVGVSGIMGNASLNVRKVSILIPQTKKLLTMLLSFAI